MNPREAGEHVQQLPEEIGLLGDKTRMKLLRLLAERPLTVGELEILLGVTQSAVSQHLAKLRLADFVQGERQGQQVLYHLRFDRIREVLNGVEDFFRRSLPESPFMAQQWQSWQTLLGQPVEVTMQVRETAVEHVSQMPLNILFVCTGNSARSQMAEGFGRALGGTRVRTLSAGLDPAGVHPMAIEVMREAGIDISHHISKSVSPEFLAEADLVVTLCGGAVGWRPASDHPCAWRYWPLPDPARAIGARYRRLQRFREVRESIKSQVLRLLVEYGVKPPPAEA